MMRDEQLLTSQDCRHALTRAHLDRQAGWIAPQLPELDSPTVTHCLGPVIHLSVPFLHYAHSALSEEDARAVVRCRAHADICCTCALVSSLLPGIFPRYHSTHGASYSPAAHLPEGAAHRQAGERASTLLRCTALLLNQCPGSRAQQCDWR